MARYARGGRIFAHAKNTVELFAFAYDAGIGPTMAEDTLECVAFANNAPSSFADDAIAAAFADPEHARALLADSDHTFEIVAEALGSSAINRVSTHPWEKSALAGYTQVAIAYSHHPAPGVRLADHTHIAATATLDTDAIRVVDRNELRRVRRCGSRAFIASAF